MVLRRRTWPAVFVARTVNVAGRQRLRSSDVSIRSLSRPFTFTRMSTLGDATVPSQWPRQ